MKIEERKFKDTAILQSSERRIGSTMQMQIKINGYSHAIHKCIRDRIASFKNVDWFALSQNPNITFEFVKENMDKPWDWSALSRNPNITVDIVKDNPDKPWNLSDLNENPNILLSIDDLVTIVKRDHFASVIQRVWRKAISDPSHLVCKRRLLREYSESP